MATRKTGTTSKAGTTSKTTRSTTTRRTTAAKSAAPTPAPADTTAESTAPVVPVRALTKKELMTRVRKSTGAKGKDLRLIVDAVLSELGQALDRGDALKLQPLGVMRVQRARPAANGETLVLKLKRKKPAPKGNDPLAEAAE